MLCYYCKKTVGRDNVPYQDLETGMTYHYHQSCFYGEVRERVVMEYVTLIRKIQQYLPRRVK